MFLAFSGCRTSNIPVCGHRTWLAVGRWFPPGTPVSSTRKLISSSSFHRLDMTLAVAEALNPNKPHQNVAPINSRLRQTFEEHGHFLLMVGMLIYSYNCTKNNFNVILVRKSHPFVVRVRGESLLTRFNKGTDREWTNGCQSVLFLCDACLTDTDAHTDTDTDHASRTNGWPARMHRYLETSVPRVSRGFHCLHVGVGSSPKDKWDVEQ